ncbi:phosphoribosylamine--glycine ligase [Apilactobacillus xinyiensis]|uniref:phosphoribosylamine--glycine ligase n=1 Tax=Apilactobacillus xinyiensis TaxID=2841032 RepID=UPI00336514D2
MSNWLVIGSGGREYVMAETLAKTNDRHVFVAPGNPMMNKLKNVETINIGEIDFVKLAEFVIKNKVVCTVVGPENPLSLGIVDYFAARNLKIFGPSKAAAKLESSKSFAKNIMKKAGVPTARYQEFTDTRKAIHYINSKSLPIVIKANGLAGGKGVVVAKTQIQADEAAKSLLSSKNQSAILVEDYLDGEEFSLFVMANGNDFITMPVSQDHKRLLNNDEGPNTGGMGAYSPVPQVSQDLKNQAIEDVIKPVLNQMNKDNKKFTGFLYAGLIMTKSGTKVIEFNVRMGDPETQVVLPQMQSDLGEVILKLLNNEPVDVKWQTKDYYLGAVVASKGYPLKPIDSQKLPKIINNSDLLVSYAGVSYDDDNKDFISSGGRIMMLTVKSSSLSTAQQKVNSYLENNINENYVYRNDIGQKGINYLNKK